ncbi:MAG: ADP-ribosylglycohydrolase family protein [Lachnospiraceae bacterium]|nr:ADP-ribosylglycohydrolase family protein [Lachnospiraceae bacterium]
MTDEQCRNMIRAWIMGGVVADALGVPVEFQKREVLKKNPVLDIREYGSHNQPRGTWSDDSSMMLATLDTPLEVVGFCFM